MKDSPSGDKKDQNQKTDGPSAPIPILHKLPSSDKTGKSYSQKTFDEREALWCKWLKINTEQERKHHQYFINIGMNSKLPVPWIEKVGMCKSYV